MTKTIFLVISAAFDTGEKCVLQKGRKGKGSIYVQGAGYNKYVGDNCAVDSNINQPYVITIAGVNQRGKPTDSSERCAAIMASAYTGNKRCEGLVAPYNFEYCLNTFSGTSAASAQGSAIIALTLEANPRLTYRDVMHLIAMSAEVAPLANNKRTWYKNKREFWVSNDFGFGLMNAKNMVTLAKDWVNVPEKRTCVHTVTLDKPEMINVIKSVKQTVQSNVCEGSANEVNYLEHVELSSGLEFPFRGDVEIYLSSPSGTKSKLLERRTNDQDPDGLEPGWSIMTTHNWGELSRGTWVVEYQINPYRSMRFVGWLKEFTIKFHGTKEMPAHYNQPRTYARFRTAERKARYSLAPYVK